MRHLRHEKCDFEVTFRGGFNNYLQELKVSENKFFI